MVMATANVYFPIFRSESTAVKINNKGTVVLVMPILHVFIVVCQNDDDDKGYTV